MILNAVIITAIVLVGALLLSMITVFSYLFLAATKLYFENGEEHMAVVYATLIINGKKNFKDVPDTIKEQVRQTLIDLDCEHLI